MKFSEQWLRVLVDPALSTSALADRLTMAGLEVERIEPVAPAFDKVVVGRIDKVEPHPNADRLRICTVDVGAADALQIVCGAPNAAAGMFVPCALEGAVLPGGMTIKRATVRGVESRGMLCSAQELGIAEDAAGLLALAESSTPGTSVRAALALDDTLLTLKLTPNRADCLSIAGIAREVAAITGAAFKLPDVAPTPVTFAGTRTVRIEDPDACPRFAARLIDGIDATAPTPLWMRQRLERSGIRSISAVVDITNYVMLELGQPLHAYDDRLLDGDIVVRFAQDGEELTLLNGQKLALDADLLLVCDQKKPLGLAGIMGGEHSGIADDTTRVYLEGAFWSPAVIRGKMRAPGIFQRRRLSLRARCRFCRLRTRGRTRDATHHRVVRRCCRSADRRGRATRVSVAHARPRPDGAGRPFARHPGIRGCDRRHVHAPSLRPRTRGRWIQRNTAFVSLRPFH